MDTSLDRAEARAADPQEGAREKASAGRPPAAGDALPGL